MKLGYAYILKNLGYAYILKSQGQPYVQFCDLTYFLWSTDLCRDFAFRLFSKKLLGLEPWNGLCIHLEE